MPRPPSDFELSRVYSCCSHFFRGMNKILFFPPVDVMIETIQTQILNSTRSLYFQNKRISRILRTVEQKKSPYFCHLEVILK